MSTLREKQLAVLRLFESAEHLGEADVPESDLRLRGLGRLAKNAIFSGFNMAHLQEARELYEVFYAAKDLIDLQTLLEQVRYLVNEGLLQYALSVAVVHRDDLVGVKLPAYQEQRPDLFVPAETIFQAIKADKRRINDQPIILNAFETTTKLDPEHQLAYFREDIGINVHHYHWHVVYPVTWQPKAMGKIKDRKGELFYYMHQQMSARYDCERLGVGLQRVIPYHNFDQKIDGYASHLVSFISNSKIFAIRPAGLILQDVNRDDPKVLVEELERWKDRIMQAAHLGMVIDESGQLVPLTVETGIDVLGDLIEASDLSINKTYYGNFHNHLHNLLSLVHDPDGRYKQSIGVLGTTATAMRDPMFFRLHRYIDNMFVEYKLTLPSYQQAELDFPGITVENVEVKATVTNVLNTFMTDDYLELKHGMVQLQGSVKVKHQHIDHEPFSYDIICRNSTQDSKNATVRIFLAPVYDESGHEIPINEQRRFFIELDKFQVLLIPGLNNITRDSKESAVTSEGSTSHEELINGSEISTQIDHSYCACGWPEYALVPRGNRRGMDFVLFVMLTDFEEDRVDGPHVVPECKSSTSYCGIRNQKYPDKRAMGYPFDRAIKAKNIEQFLLPNMKLQNIKIQFII
ncbi:hemocyanin F chain [Trichonephila clavata]|uniref:Hemocyanin F chain n=1 Tax=Trichonephila clavata TaxID=2740835 RepID=A0A8X6HGH2_TRICU|nr:hemocyanin F chain [Trichonephila clavata]